MTHANSFFLTKRPVRRTTGGFFGKFQFNFRYSERKISTGRGDEPSLLVFPTLVRVPVITCCTCVCTGSGPDVPCEHLRRHPQNYLIPPLVRNLFSCVVFTAGILITLRGCGTWIVLAPQIFGHEPELFTIRFTVCSQIRTRKAFSSTTMGGGRASPIGLVVVRGRPRFSAAS